MPKHCVAAGCTKNNLSSKDLSFYKFPNREKNLEKWKKWVHAMKRVNADGTNWEPKSKWTYVCSDHFIGK